MHEYAKSYVNDFAGLGLKPGSRPGSAHHHYLLSCMCDCWIFPAGIWTDMKLTGTEEQSKCQQWKWSKGWLTWFRMQSRREFKLLFETWLQLIFNLICLVDLKFYYAWRYSKNDWRGSWANLVEFIHASNKL